VADTFLLELVTPQRMVLSEEVEEVRLPGILGEMGVLPGHTELLTALGTGQLAYTVGGKEKRAASQGGFAEVLPKKVTVLASVAEFPDEIDVATAQTELGEAEAKLPTATAEDLEGLTDQVRLAATRIDVGGGAN